MGVGACGAPEIGPLVKTMRVDQSFSPSTIFDGWFRLGPGPSCRAGSYPASAQAVLASPLSVQECGRVSVPLMQRHAGAPRGSVGRMRRRPKAESGHGRGPGLRCDGGQCELHFTGGSGLWETVQQPSLTSLTYVKQQLFTKGSGRFWKDLAVLSSGSWVAGLWTLGRFRRLGLLSNGKRGLGLDVSGRCWPAHGRGVELREP